MSSRTYVVRALVAMAAILSLAVGHWLGVEPVRWIGLVFYLVCLAMYLQTLVIAVVATRQVTAELLVVSVMIVTLLDSQPLGGALVA